MLVKLSFPLHFILLDPDPRTQRNVDPTGSGYGSKSMAEKVFIQYYTKSKNLKQDVGNKKTLNSATFTLTENLCKHCSGKIIVKLKKKIGKEMHKIQG